MDEAISHYSLARCVDLRSNPLAGDIAQSSHDFNAHEFQLGERKLGDRESCR